MLEIVSLGCGMSSTSALATRGPPLVGLFTQVDLCLGCSGCTQRLNESTYVLYQGAHSCTCEILLARFKRAANGKIWREVGHRPRFPRPWQYKVCRYYSPGLGCRYHQNRCTFARSPEEALVWTFELKHNLSRLWLKASVQGGEPQNGPCGAANIILAEFGGHFQLLCAHCFRDRPQRLRPVDPQGRCPAHGTCPTVLVHVSTKDHKRQFTEVRPKPQSDRPLYYCMFVERGQPCRHGAARCQFAHSAVEMAVWEAEQLSGLQREALRALPILGQDKHAAPHSQASPSIQASPSSQPPEAELYCYTCLVTCHSQEAFENHCATPEHAQMVAFDQAVPWKHRAPPMGVPKFELCPRPDLCEYGDICTRAHSEQELREWIQRAQAMELREQAAWKDGLMS